jgi:DNA polymerase-3 subunit delta'
MKITPMKQENLYGYSDLFKYIKLLFDEDKLPNKIIFSGKKGIGKCTFAYHLTNYIFSIDEDKTYDFEINKINDLNKSFKLLKNYTHPNFFLISLNKDKKSIEISQIREMISFCNKSSFDNKNKIILIDNVEYLNQNSVNALLKIIEEPNEKIYFFLIQDSAKKIIATLNSRCIKFNLQISNSKRQKILNNLIKNNFYENLNSDLKNYYFSHGDYINLYNYITEKSLDENISIENLLKFIIDEKEYKNNTYIKENFSLFIELYYKKKFLNIDSNIKYFNQFKYYIKKNYSVNKFNLDLETLIIEFKAQLNNG